ncbi:white collar 1 [Paramyrothecium foliicola]|nr:white collar 1 [Paramyrothecium foliicola]
MEGFYSPPQQSSSQQLLSTYSQQQRHQQQQFQEQQQRQLQQQHQQLQHEHQQLQQQHRQLQQQHLHEQDQRRFMQSQMQQDAVNMVNHNPTSPQSAMPPMSRDQSMMDSANAFDEMMRENQADLDRRRSVPQPYSNQMLQDQNQRRMSSIDSGDIMNFGGAGNQSDLGNYQFNQAMSTAFPTLDTSGLNIQNQMGNYMPDPTDYSTMSPDLMGSMIPSTFANMNMGSLSNGSPNQMHLFPPAPTSSAPNTTNSQYAPPQLGGLSGDFSMDMNPDDETLNIDSHDATPGSLDAQSKDAMNGHQQNSPPDTSHNQTQQSSAKNGDNGMGNFNQGILARQVSSPGSGVSPQRGNSSASITQPSSSSNVTTPATSTTPRESKEKTIYSKSGFDMLKALWLVATRKNPQINLGAVDLSCAFVVCDVNMNDCPIIYVSDNFQNLTGYSRHEIIGQNCRFLQAPDGNVEAGSKREFVDDGAVYSLKKMVHEGREVQQSLINYRKGGKPFLNLLTMIPIPWDTEEIRYFIGFQIDLVECPDAISGQEMGGVRVNYKHSDIGQYIWNPPSSSQWEPEKGQTLGVDDVSTLLQQFNPQGMVSDWHKQSWDKMLLENTDDVVHVLSLKGLFLYLSPACKRVLEYDASDLVGNSLSSVCHPSDIVPVTRELKDTAAGNMVNIVFRIRRKNSGYTWFESHGSLFVEQGKGRKCIILVGRKRPVFTLSRQSLEANGGIGDSELWTKLSTSGMFLFISSNIRSLLDLQPESLVGTSIQELMRKETRADFGRAIEKARKGRIVTCKHEVQNRRGQVLQARTTLYPGDAMEGQKPSFLLAQTKLVKASSRSIAPASTAASVRSAAMTPRSDATGAQLHGTGPVSQPAGGGLPPGSQDMALASDDNIFDELRTTKCSSWQFELRQMEKINRILAEELGGLLANKKKRKRRKGVGNVVRDCANCHTRNTPEWRRGPSGQRDLCNSCGLRWAKQTGRVSPRNSSRGAHTVADGASKKSASPIHTSSLQRELSADGQATGKEEGRPTSTQLNSPVSVPGTNAPSGAPSAIGPKSTTSMMPPPSQPLLAGGIAGQSMTAIREERESSQS